MIALLAARKAAALVCGVGIEGLRGLSSALPSLHMMTNYY